MSKKIRKAWKTLHDNMSKDFDWAWSVHANIAMAIFDRGGLSHIDSNIAAAAVMKHLFDYDVTGLKRYVDIVEGPQCDVIPEDVISLRILDEVAPKTASESLVAASPRLNVIDRKFKILAVNPVNKNIYTEADSILFCAKDRALPAALLSYRDECIKIGASSDHLNSIMLMRDRVIQYQNTIEKKVPDTEGLEIERCIGGIDVS